MSSKDQGSSSAGLVDVRRHSFTEGLQEQLETLRQTDDVRDSVEVAEALDDLGVELEQLGLWLNARFDELLQLLKISTELNRAVLLDDILARIYTFFRDVIPYDRIGCALIDSDQQTVTAYWAKFTYDNQPEITPGYSAPLAGSSLADIVASGKPRILNDLEAYLAEHPNSESTQRIVNEGIRSSLTCPLLADGKPVGFLFFSSREKGTYQHLHQEVFLYIASQVAHLIEKSRLYQHIVDLNQRLLAANEQLQDKASRDALTGVLNRGAIMEFLQQQLQSDVQHDTAVLMFDIDFFKKVNDTYGHLHGDLVLRTVALQIQQSVRPNDRVGRYGGEEFLVVLTDVTPKQAEAVAERIRCAVAAQTFAIDDATMQVTISGGGAWFAQNDPTNLSARLELADRQLYDAKERGRNQVRFVSGCCSKKG
ncbi:GGDEF domain-containing protein [Pseudidiomarina sediminum]|uniref:diguanylate cyclase n=1 Tax=Pseudidiomarina sediminum TaxID=431675 RepID=A0A432Z8B4_9GAMM|nr:sensor domain-containing diguanylate cyclase [Pseudidiomarina sediminum]RUO74133.1 GGDEF domain-containing protein [Pseudidiomarina sediminum]